MATGTESAVGLESAAALKRIAAERLAAHRRRRAAITVTQAQREASVRAGADAVRRENSRGASQVREAVAARYRQSVSYREYLAAEAERALEQAQAEAEVAARKVCAVAEAQMQLLEELEQWREPDASARERAIAEQRAATRGELAHALADIALEAGELISEMPSPAVVELFPSADPEGPRVSYKVRLHEHPGGFAATNTPQANGQANAVGYAPPVDRVRPEERHQMDELDQEIEFRLAPEFEDHTLEALPIQANIIEFPRQLVASRKARPRLAEGPLREDSPPEPQLRIFEVEPEEISVAPAAEDGRAPEWQSLLLDAVEPSPINRAHNELDPRLCPQTAPLSVRLLALTVDGCCIGCGFVGFTTLVAEIAGPLLRGLQLPVLGGAAAATLLVFAFLYQMLFFTLAEATPGMRYARIGLCTFNDENPTRSAMRRRLLAVILALCPLGLGLVWMLMDDEGLGWHDRISRIYPRAY